MMFDEDSHNPYFSGNSFATWKELEKNDCKTGHNPYFSGNSFATIEPRKTGFADQVTILILVETLLQRILLIRKL